MTQIEFEKWIEDAMGGKIIEEIIPNTLLEMLDTQHLYYEEQAQRAISKGDIVDFQTYVRSAAVLMFCVGYGLGKELPNDVGIDSFNEDIWNFN